MALSASAFFALTIFGSNARADWQYTRWGMSPEAMEKASAGKTGRVASDPSQSRSGLSRMVKGAYQSGNQEFSLSGYFYANRRLRMIALSITLPSPSQAGDVRGALVAKYGPPTIVRSSRSLEWVLPG